MAEFHYSMNKDPRIPLYHQLKEVVLKEVGEGYWKTDALIPTEKEFMDHFKISRVTVRQALTDLVKDGVLYRRRGVGSFVAQPKIDLQYLNTITSYHTQILSAGHRPSRSLLDRSVGEPGEDILRAMKLPQGSEVIKLNRLFFADQQPLATVLTYHPHDKCAFILEEDLEQNSLYQLLSKYKETRIVRVERFLEAKTANREDQRLMGLGSDAAIQSITTKAYNAFGEIVEYGVSHFRGDRNTFYVEINMEA